MFELDGTRLCTRVDKLVVCEAVFCTSLMRSRNQFVFQLATNAAIFEVVEMNYDMERCKQHERASLERVADA